MVTPEHVIAWRKKLERKTLAAASSLPVKDYTLRRGTQTITAHGKGSKIRSIPVHLSAIA